MSKPQFYGNLALYYDFICSDRKKDVKILTKLIAKHKRSKGKILLDVACGTGLEDFYLQKNFDVTGIDLNNGVLKIARKRNPEVRYRRANMLDFHLNGKFDVITCFDAMCYLHNHREIAAALRNFYDHLKDGGVLIFYIDDTFLKEHRRKKTIVITDHKKTADLEVTLLLFSQQVKNKIIGQDIFFITKHGKTNMMIEPKTEDGLFEVRKIKEILRKLGFGITLYELNRKTTFSMNKYDGKHSCPVFVCEKE